MSMHFVSGSRFTRWTVPLRLPSVHMRIGALRLSGWESLGLGFRWQVWLSSLLVGANHRTGISPLSLYAWLVA